MRSLFICCWILAGIPLFGQNLKGSAFSLSYHQGKILDHSPKLLYEIPPKTWGIYLDYQLQTYGKAEWHQHQRYPLMGMALQYYFLGDRDLLGHAVGLVPNISLPLVEQNRWTAHFQLGSGIAFLDRHYDLLENPLNNAIGSGLNNITMFRLNLGVQFRTGWWLKGGGSFTHYSNGSAKMPNLGINIPSLYLGLTYIPDPVEEPDLIRWDVPKKAPHRWGANVHFDLGFKETTVPGGPKAPVYTGSVAGIYRLNKVNHLQFGLDYEYHKSIYLFSLHTFTFSEESAARKGATRWGVFLADEFLFGNISVYLQAGYYVSKASILKPWNIYNKLSIRYYLPPIGKPDTRFYAGVYLKSHKIVAEYIAIGMGAEIGPR